MLNYHPIKNGSCTLLQRRFPDFTFITKEGRLTEHLDCVIIRYSSPVVSYDVYRDREF